MTNDSAFRKVVAWAAIVSTPILYGALFVTMAAVGFDFEKVADPSLTMAAVGARAFVFWSSFVLTALAYVLWLPLVLFLWSWLRPRSANFVSLFAICGIAALAMIAISQLVVGGVALGQAAAYAQATTEATRQLHSEIYQAFFDGFDMALSRVLAFLLAGVWLTGTGSLLRKERQGLGWFTVVLGILFLVSAVGTAAGIEAIGTNVAALTIILVPIWALAMGIGLLRSMAVVGS